MATIVGISNTNLAGTELEEYIERIGKAATDALNLAPSLRSVSFFQIAKETSSKRNYEEITFWVYTAPNKPVDAKRALVKNIQDVTDEFFNGKLEIKTIVIIKEHSDENVGVGGLLRADA